MATIHQPRYLSLEYDPLVYILANTPAYETGDRAAYLGRLAQVAANYPAEVVTPDQASQFKHLLNGWNFYEVPRQRPKFGLAVREIKNESIPPLAEYCSPPRRVVGESSSGLSLLASTALRGEDLSIIFRLEGAVGHGIYIPPLARGEPASLGPDDHETRLYDKDLPANIKELINWPDKIKQITGLDLTRDEAEVIARLATPNEWIGVVMNLTGAMVRIQLSNARKRNSLALAELIRRAYQGQLIDTGTLPEKHESLEDWEKDILKQVLEPIAKAIDGTGLTCFMLSSRRSKIYRKLGVSFNRAAYIMGLHCHLID